jgi:hypothetical protein
MARNLLELEVTDNRSQSSMARQQSASASNNQGEGDRSAARRFNRQEREFVESQRGRDAVAEHQPLDEDAARGARTAATEAKQRAREHDPKETRDYRKPAK